MRYLIYLLLLIAVISPLGVFAYQQQGFTSYSESTQGISFQCSQQCFILLGSKADNDSVKIEGVKGQGQAVVGALGQNGQLVPLGQQNVTLDKQDYTIIISSSQGAIPNEVQLGVVFAGSIGASSAKISLGSLSFGQKIDQGWKDFWANEGQTFYSINLRYGHKIGSRSIVSFVYIIASITIIILFFIGRATFKTILLTVLILYLIIAVRNQIDYSRVTIDGLRSYTFAQAGSKTYGNLGDFYELIDGVRESIGLDQGKIDQCKIYYECSQPWPYCAHMDTVFMKPCEKSETLTGSDYQLYYKVFPKTPLGKKMFEFNGSLLYQTN